MNMSDAVEMRLAFEWTCPDCGTDQFERSMMPDMGDDELAELKDEHGIEPFDIGEFQMQPTKVTCERCSRTFPTFKDGT